jgi:trans-2,3-dihydro-3-hydroxyanthranilate isomerase
MQIPFVTVDVFTDRKFGGNPLAVIPDGRGLSGAQMQAIAGEFNLAETTFVLPPREQAHTAEVRIFTPRAELPFAGHPNIGTAFVLAQESERAGRAVSDPMIFEEKAGLVRISLLKESASVIGARLAPPQALVRGEDVAVEVAAAACSLEPSDIETANHPAVHRILRHSIHVCRIKNARGARRGAAARGNIHQTPARRSCDRCPALCEGAKRRL